MKTIRIISGVYGFRPGKDKHPAPVQRGECCTVSDEEAERLVQLGVAALEELEETEPEAVSPEKADEPEESPMRPAEAVSAAKSRKAKA